MVIAGKAIDLMTRPVLYVMFLEITRLCQLIYFDNCAIPLFSRPKQPKPYCGICKLYTTYCFESWRFINFHGHVSTENVKSYLLTLRFCRRYASFDFIMLPTLPCIHSWKQNDGSKREIELSRTPTFWIYPPQAPLTSTKMQDLYHYVSGYSIPWKILTQRIYIPDFKKNQ